MGKKHRCDGSDHISSISHQYHFFNWKTIWDDKANKSLKKKRSNPNVLFSGDRTRKGRKGDQINLPDKKKKEDAKQTDNDYKYEVPRNKLQLNLRVLNVDFTAIKDAEFELQLEGRDASYTGKTNNKGEIVAEEIPLHVQRGKLAVRVSAEDAKVEAPKDGDGDDQNEGGAEGAIEGDVPVTWELKVGGLNPVMEQAPDDWCISGVQQRLNNLAINSGPVDGKLGPNTKSAVEAFQSMFELEKDGKPGQQETQPKLADVHDKKSFLGPPPKSAAKITPVPKDKKRKTTTDDIGHVAPDFKDGTFFNTVVIRPEYRISLRLGDIENLFPQKPDTDLGRMARLQVLGLYYFPLGHKVSTTEAEYARGWNQTLAHVKEKVFGLPSDAEVAKVDDGIRLWLKSRVVHGGVLPKPADDPKKAKDENFRKVRLPGGYSFVTPLDANSTKENVDAPNYPFDFGSSLYAAETKYFTDNPVLGKIPLVAKVEKKVGGKWKLAKDVTVYFQLVKPYDLPSFDFSKPMLKQINRPPLRESTMGDRMGKKRYNKGHGPQKAVEAEEKFNYDENADDPQTNNCHQSHGGKRGTGSLNDGTDVADVAFKLGDVKGFNSDHSGDRKLPHPAFPAVEAAGDAQHPHSVKAKTNEEGEAGVIFMPSRCGGDRYSIRAYVGPPTLPSDGTGPDGVRVETGTFVMWRNVRVSRAVRQDVGNTVAQPLLDEFSDPAASSATYLKEIGVSDKKGNYVGLPDYNFSDKAQKKAGKLGGAFDGIIAQFARGFCELEIDSGSTDPEILADAEWEAACDQAVTDAKAKKASYMTGTNDVDLDLLFMHKDPNVNVGNAATHMPLHNPRAYDDLCVAQGKTRPAIIWALDGSGSYDPTWISEVARLVHDIGLYGFIRHLSKNGFLPGLTLVQGGYASSWQILGHEEGYGGLATHYRGCFDWYGKAIYLKKVTLPAKLKKNRYPYCYDYSSTVAHEMGHLLFRVHAPGKDHYDNSEEGAGHDATKHDPLADCLCGMSYKTCEGQFCGKCLLALRGWDISAL